MPWKTCDHRHPDASIHGRPHPTTRAEVTDVVNAIYDGTDAVMLSEETASGQFPVEAVQMMAKIVQSAEEEFPFDQFLKRERMENLISLRRSAMQPLTAEEVKAAAIVTPTESGSTAQWVSRLRPRQPILALSRHLSTIKGQSLLGRLSCPCP